VADKDLAYYKRLPYNRVLEPQTEGGFIARIEEIPWIRIDGETREEALLRLHETFEDCVTTLIERGDEVPEPVLWPESVGPVPQDPVVRRVAFASSHARLPLAAAPPAPPPRFDVPAEPWTSESAEQERILVGIY
jgi:predicted RNase H-like HicB family nuclease